MHCDCCCAEEEKTVRLRVQMTERNEESMNQDLTTSFPAV